jgi:hypothetical protein
MDITAPLVVSAVWMLLFRKFPSWNWFRRLIDRFPSPLKNLWAVWTDCTYCGGFWIALLVRYVTGIKFLTFQPGLMPADWYFLIDWYLDALTTGLVALLIIRILDALAAVAPKH